MVRLKANVVTTGLFPIEFQFHYGTIKRISNARQIKLIANFNSTMVRLKAFVPDRTTRSALYFNSTMVRLKGGSSNCLAIYSSYFNSTMVRLKANTSIIGAIKDVNFNSTMVRLKVRVLPLHR